MHSPMLRGTKVQYVDAVKANNCEQDHSANPVVFGESNQKDIEQPPLLHNVNHTLTNKHITTTCLLDDGSDCDLITKETAGYL